MATLADFDLLWDIKDSVINKPWGKPEVREAMTLYFHMKRAKEEIHRLNIEIRRQITYMRDEHTLYRSTASCIRKEQPHLSAYIAQECDHRDASFTYITFYLIKTSCLSMFSGQLTPGTWEGVMQPHHATPMVNPPTWWSALQGKSSSDVVIDDGETSDEEGEGHILLDLVANLTVAD
jgi:hypothetical protein